MSTGPFASKTPEVEIVRLRRDDLDSSQASLQNDDSEKLLRRVREGFAELSVADAHKDSALANLRNWLAISSDTRAQIEWLAESGAWSTLLDSFYRVLPFGTGGRRGPVGIGTNRYNPLSLASSVQGHIGYLHDRYPDQELSVVIVYDVRQYYDLRGVYNPAIDNPLLGVTSKDFAMIAAEVYAGNGIRSVIPPDDADWYVSTPELSFAIRELGATGGLNISASHNHPDDNGGKFYNRYGGQEVPPNDEDMAKRVESATFLRRMPLERAREAGLVSEIPASVHRRYIEINVAQSLRPEAHDARIVFTPLHGAGDASVGRVLLQAGFEVVMVPEQSTHDGRFPAVPFRAPNPEVPESMQMGIDLARQTNADVVMACDPDADRIGICAKTTDGDFQVLSGNEIAVLVTHYKLSQLKELGRLPKTPLVIKTEVTTELLRPITESVGGKLIGDLLVGFKYVGTILEQLEFPPAAGDPRPQPLRRLGIEATLDDFIIGVEESHGVLVTADVRDKDAAGAAILLAELTALQRSKGETVTQYLENIHREHGYYASHLTSMVMTGADGLEAIKKIQKSLRDRAPQKIADWKVVAITDHLDPEGIHGPILSETDRSSRDVILFRLENGARAIIRPSGTEPKNKVYVEVPSREALGGGADSAAYERQKKETNAIARRIADDFTLQMLQRIDVRLPLYALRVSGLVSLDKRIHFAEHFIPGLEVRAGQLVSGESSRDEVSKWIDATLASYGNDARELVGDGVAAFLAERRREGAGSSQQLDAVEDIFFAQR